MIGVYLARRNSTTDGTAIWRDVSTISAVDEWWRYAQKLSETRAPLTGTLNAVHRLLDFYIFILFHQTVVAKKTQTHTYTYNSQVQIYNYIRTYKNNIYTYTTVYVEAIELHDIVGSLFHSLDKYKPNLTSNFCMRLAHRTLSRSKLKHSWQCLTVSMLLVLNNILPLAKRSGHSFGGICLS